MTEGSGRRVRGEWTRREFLQRTIGGGLAGAGAGALGGCGLPGAFPTTFIAKVANYAADIGTVVTRGLRELGVLPAELTGKRVLLKPNLVEPHRGRGHVNTHPAVVRGAAEAFLRMGASRVIVGEGSGHCRDSLMVLEESGLGDALAEDRIPFVDLNADSFFLARNAGGASRLSALALPEALRGVDWVVSVAKMKTHHWAGVTLSMKNLFGILPGSCYGWPKNALHWEGIDKCVIDVVATARPAFAIVDGVVGMEGDGPIMGTPRDAGVIIMGRSPLAVDATCARIMGVDPRRVPYLSLASRTMGPIQEWRIRQAGESVSSVRSDFLLLDAIPAQKGLRLPAKS